MTVKGERQLNFLLPINSTRNSNETTHKALKPFVVPAEGNSEKRYMQIKESLKNKGLIKSR